MSVIELNNLHYQVNDADQQLHIVRGCHLSVNENESIAITGRSGSGKSTLLSLMSGLLMPTSGEIRLLNQPLSDLNEDQRAELRAGKIGFVFQDFQLMPAMTALENVMMPLELFDIPDAQSKAQDSLNSLGLGERLNHLPHQLSGGEQQRVAIARAWVMQPQLIFADEPTGNLDQQNAHAIQKRLLEIPRQQNATLVVVTHDPEFAAQCDRTFELIDGQLVETQP